MKIEFAKITSNDMKFCLEKDAVKFEGHLRRVNQALVECKSKISGEISCLCSRCGEEMSEFMDSELNLILSDGYYKNSANTLDAIEFFGGEIDLDEIMNSEIESFKSDYFYCKNCKI